MTIGSGGRTMFKFSPVREDGKTRKFDNISGDVNMIGVHTGDSAGLNVCNPIPGMYYQWAKSDPTSMMREFQKGGQTVKQGDEDHPAFMLGIVNDNSDTRTPLDTSQVYQDVVLMRYPDKVIAARREREEAESLRAVKMADSGFLGGASEAEIASGRGERTRFAQRRHSLQVQDESGVVQQQWTPEQGILDN